LALTGLQPAQTPFWQNWPAGHPVAGRSQATVRVFPHPSLWSLVPLHPWHPVGVQLHWVTSIQSGLQPRHCPSAQPIGQATSS
jgi:hypothetical protein